MTQNTEGNGCEGEFIFLMYLQVQQELGNRTVRKPE